jgi:peptidoglycan-N-acetylglucosamine deacetylase
MTDDRQDSHRVAGAGRSVSGNGGSSAPRPVATGAAKPLASISLDLDNQWSYMKIHGDQGWEKYPSYFDIFIPHVLDLLDAWNLKITFFIVGIDARLSKNQPFLEMIADRGHEVGNHSLNHESWLQKYSREELTHEIDKAEDYIVAATGKKPIGFRGPGFSWSVPLLEILAERNYRFDASTLPTYIGPLARMYYFWKSDLSKAEKKDRNELFGNMKSGLQRLDPYLWRLPSGRSLLEIPVTTIPVVKTPFHLSYLLYLSRYSMFLMKFYLSLAIGMCKIKGIQPSYLLHPLDLIGGDKIEELAFFPGMDITSDRKVTIFNVVIGSLCRHFNLVGMGKHAGHLVQNRNLKSINTGI